MSYRVVSCIAVGFILAGLVASALPCMAQTQNHGTAPALKGPANASGEKFQATESELEKMGEAAGQATGKMVETAIEHPLDGAEHGAANQKDHGEGHPLVNKNPLEWRADTAVWTGIVFLVVFALLYKFAWGPISQGLDKRESGIADHIASAKRLNEEARALLDEYQSQLDAAEDEVKAMIDKARIDAQKTGQKIVEAAQTAAEEEQKRALTEIEQATTGALSELAAKSADLAIDLAGKIVKSELKASDHAALVTEAVSNFGKPK